MLLGILVRRHPSGCRENFRQRLTRGAVVIKERALLYGQSLLQKVADPIICRLDRGGIVLLTEVRDLLLPINACRHLQHILKRHGFDGGIRELAVWQ